MSIPFEMYCKIKNKYCLAYFGRDETTLRKLIEIRPLIELKFPELQIFISCTDTLYGLLENKENIIAESYLRPFDYGHIRILQLTDKPLETLIKECDLRLVKL
jgi:hypothetical protein